jgi:hypothetical protein
MIASMGRAESSRQRHAEHEEATASLRDGSDRDQIVERLGWTPRQRLDYLLDMLAFEDRAHRARRVA